MMLGAQELSQTCASLELMGRDSNLSEAGLLLEEAAAALGKVETAIGEIVGPAALPAEGSAA